LINIGRREIGRKEREREKKRNNAYLVLNYLLNFAKTIKQ